MGIATKDEPCFPGQQICPRPSVRAVRVAGNGERQPNVQSGKNEVMRILIFRKRRAKLPRTLNQRTRETVAALVRVRIGLLDRPYDQRTDGSPGLLGPIPQPVVQWVRDVDCSTDRHDMTMS